MGNSRTWLLSLLKFALAAAILGYLCRGPLDLRKLAHVPVSSSLFVLAALLLGSMLVPVVRWWWLLRVQKIDASLWDATRLTWVGYITALLLPGAASGDVAKSYLILRRRTDGRARSLSTVLVDRFVGLYSLVLLGSLSAAWLLLAGQCTASMRTASYGMFALLAGATFAPAILLIRSVRRLIAGRAPAGWAQAWSESYGLYAESKLALVGCLLLSLVSSALTAASLVAADRVLDGASSWGESLLLGPLVVLANCIPLTPGGIGVAEATSSGLFNMAGTSNGAEMMLMTRLVMAVLSLPALLALFARQPVRISSSPKPAAPTAESSLTTETVHRPVRAA
jgi:glycosyltransferase 2 family protein